MSPKGFYLNRGIFRFCEKIEADMNAAERVSRKNRKPGEGVDQLARSARLRVLEQNLGINIKRHRDPGNVTNTNPFTQGKDAKENKDTSTIVMRGF